LMAMFGISNHLLVGFLVQFVGMQHLAKGVSQVAVAVVCRLDRASNQSRPKAATVETEDTVPTLARRTPESPDRGGTEPDRRPGRDNTTRW
jgi:hypothetical protein